MTARVTLTLSCDGRPACPGVLRTHAPTGAQAYALARDEGWKHTPHRTICPTCARKGYTA